MALWSSMKFQNFMSPTNSQLESLHDLITVWLVVVILMVMIISLGIFLSQIMVNLPMDSATLEVTWTIIPMIILITIAVPSLNLLCLQDTSLIPPKISTKLISNQWNWQTEQVEGSDHLLDSEKLDELGGYESPLLLPSSSLVRVMLTSSDVLHSLGVPALGLKLDSAPGRLNSVIFEAMSKGLFPGSCYELCGSGHSAMPIYILLL